MTASLLIRLRRGCHDAATCGIARSGHLVVARESRQLDARVDAELREHVPEMAVHRVRRDKEALGDLAIGHAFGDESRDGELGARQRRPAPRPYLTRAETSPTAQDQT